MNAESRLTRLEKVLGFNTTSGERTRKLLDQMSTVASLLQRRHPKVFEAVVEALSANPEADRWGLVGAMPIVFEVLREHPKALATVEKKVRSAYPASGPRLGVDLAVHRRSSTSTEAESHRKSTEKKAASESLGTRAVTG